MDKVTIQPLDGMGVPIGEPYDIPIARWDGASDDNQVLSLGSGVVEFSVPLDPQQFINVWALFNCQRWHEHDIESCVPMNIVLGEN